MLNLFAVEWDDERVHAATKCANYNSNQRIPIGLDADQVFMYVFMPPSMVQQSWQVKSWRLIKGDKITDFRGPELAAATEYIYLPSIFLSFTDPPQFDVRLRRRDKKGVREEGDTRVLALASLERVTRPQHHDEVRACWRTLKGPRSFELA